MVMEYASRELSAQDRVKGGVGRVEIESRRRGGGRG